MHTITTLTISKLFVPLFQTTMSFLVELRYAALRVFITAANVKCFLIVADVFCWYSKWYRLSRNNVSWNLLPRPIAYKISSWRTCSVLLCWCRDLGAEPRAGAKSPKSTHSPGLGFTKPLQCNMDSHVACHHARSKIAWNSRNRVSIGVWSVEMWSWCWKGKIMKRSCYMVFAFAPNPAPCQQLSIEGNAGYASLHGSTKAFRIEEQELSNSIWDCLGLKLVS